jgi:hypothetical protein
MIKGTSAAYNGEYIAERVEHELSAYNGYTTRFYLKRNMADEEAAKALNPNGRRAGGLPVSATAASAADGIVVREEDGEEENPNAPECYNLTWRETGSGKQLKEALVDEEVTLCYEVKNIADGETVTFKIFEQGDLLMKLTLR